MQGNHKSGSSEGLAIDGQSEDSEPDQGAEESDSSEDEVHCFHLPLMLEK